jgi:Zn-dependent protease with chaperone function
MTATRIVRGATLAVAAVAWGVAAVLLWRTTVPTGLRLPRLDERVVFGSHLVSRAQRFERFLDWNWVAATLVGLAAYVAVARRGRTLARGLELGRVNGGIVLGVLTFTVVWAATLPFALAAVWWERRHHVARESYLAALAGDWLRLLSTTIVAVAVLAIVIGLAGRFPRRWWLGAAPALAGILLVLQLLDPFLASVGTKPLRNPALVRDVRRLERREHAGHPPVRVEDVSGRTREENAFALGIGPTERVILWNTLLGGSSFRQVRFVLGHELAHLARNHIARGVAWFALLALPILLVTARVADVRNPAAVPLALLVVAVAQLALLPLQNAVSRRYEAEADWIGLTGSRDPAAAAGVFERFVATSLEDPSPPGWVEVLLDDHPTPLRRVEMARAWRASNP